MIDKSWDELTTENFISPEAINAIDRKNLLIERFGEWPTFEDAEVLSIEFNRGNFKQIIKTNDWDQYISPSLTAAFYLFDNRYSDLSLERKPTEVVIRFEGLENLEIDGFNHQNPIVGLRITFVFSDNLKRNMFAVDWGGTGIHHEVSFTCENIIVLSVEALTF